MAKKIIINGETGLVTRNKLNDNFTELYDNRNVVTTVHFGGYNPGDSTSTLASVATLEADTNTSDLGVLLFYQVTTTFSLARWNAIKAFLDAGRTVVVNLEPMYNLAQINAGNADTAFTEFKNYVEAYALATPSFDKSRLLVKFMHEGNLSVLAYPWVIYTSTNLGVTFDKLTTPVATVQTAINNFKTAYERLATILGNTYLQRIFELEQDNWGGAPQLLDLFYPDESKYEVASVNSYNRFGIASGYSYWSSLGHNLIAWTESAKRMAPNKDWMIGECSTTAGGVVNVLGTIATISSGGTGFPPSTTANIPSSAITHNGDVAPVLTYTTNASGVITAIGCTNKGNDMTVLNVASSFDGGTGASITINLRQTGVNKPDWIRDAFEYVRDNTNFKYFGWFLENVDNSGANDDRDWSLNTTKSKEAFGEGWGLLNSRVEVPKLGGKVLPNLFSDPFTTSTTGWDSAGSFAGTVNTTSLATNLPNGDRNVTSAIRLTQSSGGASNGIAYNNRLRYSVPYWNGSGSWNGGIQPNEVVTIEFDALFKPNNGNVPDYKAPLVVVIEDTITSNYERGSSPQIFLTKQMKRYRVVQSNGQASTAGWYISFLAGGIEVPGELIMTNFNAYIGDQTIPLFVQNITKAQATDLTDGGSTTLHTHDFKVEKAVNLTEVEAPLVSTDVFYVERSTTTYKVLLSTMTNYLLTLPDVTNLFNNKINLNGNNSAITYENFTPSSAPTYQEGRVWYDSTTKTLSVYDNFSGTSIQLGKELVVDARNNTGSQINNGQVVYISGALGQNPTIALGQANSLATSEIIGVATHNIANNTTGKITVIGMVNDIDTSAFIDGQQVFLSSSTAGGLTATPPISPNFVVFVGYVAHAHPTTGKLLVMSDRAMANNNSLGTSQVVFPTQNSVKTYVDTNTQKLIKTPLAKITGGGATQFGLIGQNVTGTGTTSIVINTIRYIPLYIPYNLTLTAIQCEVTTAPASTSNLRFALYPVDNEFQPTTLLVDFGAISVASAFTGIKNVSVSQVVTAGWYLVACNTNVTLTLRSFTSPSPIISSTMGASPFVQRFEVASTYGAFASTGVQWNNVNTSAGGLQNILAFQWLNS